MKITADAERLGAAAALLSLDRIVPYYAVMGLTPAQNSAEAVKLCVREAIVFNRKEFLANPTVVPDLESNLKMVFDQYFGSPGTAAFFRWYKEDFVHSAADYPPCFRWNILLGLARGDPERWSALALPPRVSEKARSLFCQSRETNDIESIEEQMEELRLSEWDAQMYVIHGFDDDDDDSGTSPFMWVRETVIKRRFLDYLRWLCGQLSEPERQAFFSTGNLLRTKISTTRDMLPFPYPCQDQV
jgi:hypothetical protein